MVRPDLPRGVDALRAFLEGPTQETKPVQAAPATLHGVGALRALLEGGDASTPATLPKAAKTKVITSDRTPSPVPLALFQAPAPEDVAA